MVTCTKRGIRTPRHDPRRRYARALWAQVGLWSPSIPVRAPAPCVPPLSSGWPDLATRDHRAEAEGSHASRRGRVEVKMSINPMQRAHDAPRCKARSKRTGQPCRSPAVRGWKVCRMHGARGGAPEGKRNGNYRHGGRTKEMIGVWKLIKSLR
jgi:hypothetical protein